MPEPRTPPHWARQLGQRIRHQFLFKTLGATMFLTLFFVGYFWVMAHPLRPVFVMPTTALDDAIPFCFAVLPVYFSLWAYVSLPSLFSSSLSALVHYGVWIGLMCLCCLTIFWCLPTRVPSGVVDLVAYPAMSFLYRVDIGGNACPSLHVASAVFSAVWLHALGRRMVMPKVFYPANIGYCLLIVWSTIATRQHVALDALAGVAVGGIFAWLAMRWVRRQPPDAV